MSKARLYTSLPLSAFAAAVLISAAPAAWAQCKTGAGGSMMEDMTTAQQQGAGAGTTAQQGDTAMAGDSDIETGQGGTTTGETGATTAQPGAEGSGTTAQQGGSTTGETAALDSPNIEGADEQQVKTMLEQQGYSEVSSIYSCGAYYEATAMKEGKETTLMIDMSTGRITPQ